MLKQLVLSGMLLVATLPALAQSSASVPALPGRYCVVRSLGVINDSRPNFTLDCGLPAKYGKIPENEQLSTDFKAEALHSIADLLNYMDRTGWELVQTNAVGGAMLAGSLSYVEYQYVFRRKASQ